MNTGINQNIPEADYHAFPALSKSTLWKFAKNPHKWHATKDIPFTPTASMTWGSLVDCLLLQPDQFDACFTVSPFADFRTKEAKAWRDSETREIVTETQKEDAECAVDAIMANEFAWKILRGAETQASVLHDGIDPTTGESFKAKCRIDIVPNPDGEFPNALADLKTTRSLEGLGRTVAEFGYHVQAAWYLDLYNAATGEDRDEWLFIWQESEAPYEVAVTRLDADAIAEGREWYLRALALWCECHRDNRFPSPFDGEIRTINLPGWAFGK